MAKKKPQPEKIMEFFQRYLHYEVWMLRSTYDLLIQSRSDIVINNALIESFCIHARNLIEFFKNHKSCDFDPRWFTNNNFRLKRTFVRDGLVRKINTQISHLTCERTTEVASKIGPKDRAELLNSIESELTRWCNALTDEWKDSAHSKFD